MLVYVDDLLIMSQSLHASQELKEALKAAFPMKDLGAVTSYLGMDISRDWSTKQNLLVPAQAHRLLGYSLWGR